MVPFWIPIIIRHLIFRVAQKRTIILTTNQISWASRPSDFKRMRPTVEGLKVRVQVQCFRVQGAERAAWGMAAALLVSKGPL